MGNSLYLCCCQQSERNGKSQLNYGELHRIVKLKDQLKHLNTIHTPSNKHQELYMRHLKSAQSGENQQNNQQQCELLTSIDSICYCDTQQFHRLISQDISSQIEQGKTNLMNQALDKESLLDIPLYKMIYDCILRKYFEIINHYMFRSEDNRNKSWISTNKNSDTSSIKLSTEQSLIQLVEEDIPDFCVKCDECTNQIQQMVDKAMQNEVDVNEQIIQSINQQIHSLLSQGQISCKDKKKKCDPEDKNHKHHNETHHHHHKNSQKTDYNISRRLKLKDKLRLRKELKFKSPEYNLSRKETISKVSIVIYLIIKTFTQKILNYQEKKMKESPSMRHADRKAQFEEINYASLYFHEHNYKKNRKERILYHENENFTNADLINSIKIDVIPSINQLENFITKIFLKMKLSNEVCLLSLIYLERILKKSKIQILSFNYKPLVFASILIGAKYWEDVNFWNIDFVDSLNIYQLKQVNELERLFISLCQYELYVPEDLYENYYYAIIKKTQEEEIRHTSHRCAQQRIN